MAQYTVALRGGFSDRNKIKAENTSIQTEEFDRRTRVALLNITDIIIQGYFPGMRYAHYISRDCPKHQDFMKNLMANVYNEVVDWSKRYEYERVSNMLQDTLLNDAYDAILTVIEYIAAEAPTYLYQEIDYRGKLWAAEDLYNLVFEQEFVGYRFVNCMVQPITDKNEIQSITEAVNSHFTEVNQHINKALGFLSDRQSPDYANSIKESISAVERMCSIILGKPTTLGAALKKLEDNSVVIHPALKSAFSQLYGYTSDASGIRHSGELGGKESTFEEAKFMLVSCCAFVNYLTGLLAKCP